jgi:hypothetical protein
MLLTYSEMVATTLPVDHRAKPKFIKISRAELVQSLSTQVSGIFAEEEGCSCVCTI